MNVYVIMHGEYSDQRITAVFSEDYYTEAKKFAELSDGYLQEFELNSLQPEDPPAGKIFVRLNMLKDGTVASIWTEHPLDYQGKRRKSTYSVDNVIRWNLAAHLYALSEEHAIKVVNELRGHILAGCTPNTNNDWQSC